MLHLEYVAKEYRRDMMAQGQAMRVVNAYRQQSTRQRLGLHLGNVLVRAGVWLQSRYIAPESQNQQAYIMFTLAKE